MSACFTTFASNIRGGTSIFIKGAGKNYLYYKITFSNHDSEVGNPKLGWSTSLTLQRFGLNQLTLCIKPDCVWSKECVPAKPNDSYREMESFIFICYDSFLKKAISLKQKSSNPTWDTVPWDFGPPVEIPAKFINVRVDSMFCKHYENTFNINK